MSPMQNTAAKPYAAALHILARERNLAHQISGQLEELARIWQSQGDFKTLMLSPKVELSEKRGIMTDLGQSLNFDQSMRNLVNLILDKGRINILPDLATEFRILEDQLSRRVRAQCKSARPLKEQQLTQLKDKLLKATGAREIIITAEIDPSLLAGFVVSIDGRMIDGSLRGRLLRVQRSLSRQKQQEG